MGKVTIQKMSNTSTIEELKALTDDALFALLKQNGLAVGPVQSTTRNLYERRLIKHFKENRDSENSFNQSIADQSNSTANNFEQQIPEQMTRSPSKRISKHSASQQENENDDDDIIITHEVNSPSQRGNKSKNTDNLLDFKLLTDENLNDQGEMNMFSTQTISSSAYDADRSLYTGLGNSPGRSILVNRNRPAPQQQQQQYDSRPRINWASDAGLAQENHYESTSLYNAQPPPSPYRKENSNSKDKSLKSDSASAGASWSNFFMDKLKLIAYLVLTICVIYFFIIYLQSYNLENPVDL